MQKTSNRYQRGFAHVIAIVLTLVLIGAVGYVGFRAITNNKSLGEAAADTVASIAASQECLAEYDDEDLCKFLNSWNVNQKFKVESTNNFDGQTSASVMTIDGEKSYFMMDGEYAMEVVTIGDTTYTKAGDTWWKQTAEKVDEPESVPSKDDFDFEEPEEGTDDTELTKYIKMDNEACGDLTCFKYQIVDPEDSETTEYIWFDNKDYLIRRTLSESSDGKSESVFSYDNISVEEPSPVKELGPNQYIIPGQTEPQTMPDVPSEAEIEAMMQQYAQ